MATASTVSPLATLGRSARRCVSLAASSTASVPSTPELMHGPGSGARSVHRAGRLARAATDADASRHAHALDVRGAAGMDGNDAVALLLLQERLRRAPGRIGRERRRPHRVEDGAGHPEPGHLAVI